MESDDPNSPQSPQISLALLFPDLRAERHWNGQLLIEHAEHVGHVLSAWNAPRDVVLAALLHYAAPAIGIERAQKECEAIGGRCSLLPDLAKLGELLEGGPDSRTADSDPWLATLFRRSPLVFIIKIADLLATLRPGSLIPASIRDRFAQRVLNVYVPFADRLGMRAATRTLKDGAFALVSPALSEELARKKTEWQQSEIAVLAMETFRASLQRLAPSATVAQAPMSLYGLDQRKLQFKDVLPPLVVLTSSSEECYRLLGIIHSLWPPVAGEFRDYIGAPRPNAYRGLHTRVRRPRTENITLVIMIRSLEMNLVAEQGQTAVWQGVADQSLPSPPQWPEPPPGQIAVFTPECEPKILPSGSTPIDFAYAIHRELGHQCMGVVLNGRSASLETTLRHGDVVKILKTTQGLGPQQHWLTLVRSERAKSAITQWFKSKGEHRREAVGDGKVARSVGVDVPERRYSDKAIDFAFTLARCCSPQPPEEIVLCRNQRGGVIHRTDCGNARRNSAPVRMSWPSNVTPHESDIEIDAVNRVGLVADLGNVMSAMEIDMTSFHGDMLKDGSARFQLGIGSERRRRVQKTLRSLEAVPGVHAARVTGPSFPSRFARGSAVDLFFSNPYSLKPATGDAFFGRREELATLASHLRDVRSGQSILIWGPERIGKTSLLLEFTRRFLPQQDFLPVIIDLLGLSGRTVAHFLHTAAQEIAKSLSHPDVGVPEFHRMLRGPLNYFTAFLDAVRRVDQRHLVIVIDEFPILTRLRAEADSLESVFDHFRHLVQQGSGISFIFSGAGPMAPILADEVTTLLKVTHQQRIGMLEEADALDLIGKPVTRFRYDQSVLNLIARLTACHPFYITLLCEEIVHRADRLQLKQIKIEMIERVLVDWLSKQQAPSYKHLWNHDERLRRVVLAIAKASSAGEVVDSKIVAKYSYDDEFGAESQIGDALRVLVEMDTVEAGPDGYRLRIPLFERWLLTTTGAPR